MATNNLHRAPVKFANCDTIHAGRLVNGEVAGTRCLASFRHAATMVIAHDAVGRGVNAITCRDCRKRAVVAGAEV